MSQQHFAKSDAYWQTGRFDDKVPSKHAHANSDLQRPAAVAVSA